MELGVACGFWAVEAARATPTFDGVGAGVVYGAVLIVVSWLAFLICDRRGTGGTSSGIVGTGGAFLGPGEGERKVLSVIDALLLRL